MPKSIEDQFIKKVWVLSLSDKETIAEVLRLPNYDPVVVALCTDGGSNVTAESISKGLRDLYAVFGIPANVIVRTFSFLTNNTAAQRLTLMAADIFWFAGVHQTLRLKDVLRRSSDETRADDLAALVRRRVQHDHMPYVGVCGGASIASSPETCVYGCGLDLLQGREIHYACQTDLSNRHFVQSRLEFTEKCAFAVVLRADRIDAVCFPCVKNAGQLWGFAEEHGARLHRLALELAQEWQEFQTETGVPWFFNLCGYVRFKHSNNLHLV